MDEPEHQEHQRDTARTIKLILLTIVAILAILFVFKNKQDVEVSFVFTTVDIPLVWALVAALALGFAGGWLTKSFRNRG